MLILGGLVDHHALVLLVDGVLLGHRHGGQDLAGLGVGQCDVITFIDALGGDFVGGQGDRDRPEQTVGHLHAVTDAFPVCVGHEAFERGEATDTHHNDVTGFAGRYVDPGQAFRTRLLGCQCVALEQ